MTRSVWGWVALNFHDPDSDEVVVRGMKVTAQSTSDWKTIAREPELLHGAVEEFQDATLCFASRYTQEGDVLSLRVDELTKDEWESAEAWWFRYFEDCGFVPGEWVDLPHEDGVRPHLTPDDQIRSDDLEELLEYLG